ncbi:hypothetical protein [Bacterioplanoides sp.]|uniref:hypothetical protein n=1 Tax=Bacterioplanoides sp. TaxID=2066072 RepID=UPI003B59101E
MHLIIIRPHNLVVVDTDALNFDLSDLTPDNLYALQWDDSSGHTEYTGQENETISTLPDWATDVVNKHRELLQKQRASERLLAVSRIILSNGQARKDRVTKQIRARAKQEQQTINQFVREQMT